VNTVKKATRSESRGLQNLFGLVKPRKQAHHPTTSRYERKPPRGFGARKSVREKNNGVVTKILRALKLKS